MTKKEEVVVRVEDSKDKNKTIVKKTINKETNEVSKDASKSPKQVDKEGKNNDPNLQEDEGIDLEFEEFLLSKTELEQKEIRDKLQDIIKSLPEYLFIKKRMEELKDNYQELLSSKEHQTLRKIVQEACQSLLADERKIESNLEEEKKEE